MPRIVFYVLASGDSASLKVFACRFVEKSYRAGHTVYIRTGDESEARKMDDLLWSFRAGSFIPHALAGNLAHEDEPVLIGYRDERQAPADVLLNLSAQVPSLEGCGCVVELVDQNEELKKISREHYRFYKNQGYTVETHQIE